MQRTGQDIYVNNIFGGVYNDSYMYQLAFSGIITNVKQYSNCSMQEVRKEIACLSTEMISKSPYTYIDILRARAFSFNKVKCFGEKFQ